MSGLLGTISRTAPTCPLRGSRIALGALPSAVPCARAHTRAVLSTWDAWSVIDNAEVVVTELVTNAITHGSQGHDSGPIPVVKLDLLLARALFIDVWDGSTDPPVMRALPETSGGVAGAGEPGEPAGSASPGRAVPALPPDGGRGLLLVSALCTSWRSDVVDGWPGKRVRAVLAIG